jgi:opacity protein-like surface antigen
MKSFVLTALLFLAFASAQKVPNFLYTTTPILKPGDTLSGTLDEEDGQNLKDGSRLEVIQGRYLKGDVLEFRLGSQFDGYLTMYGPDKMLLASNDDTASTPETDGAGDSYLSSIITEIPETGRYVFIVSGYAAYDLGDYELSATPLELGQEGPITLPAEQNGILAEEDDIAEFDGGGNIGSLGELNYDSYTFELKEAATVRAEVNSPTLDTVVELLDADGQQLAFNDDQNSEDDPSTTEVDESANYTTNAGLEISLEPGTYELRASAYSLGFYTLSVSVAK